MVGGVGSVKAAYAIARDYAEAAAEILEWGIWRLVHAGLATGYAAPVWIALRPNKKVYIFSYLCVLSHPLISL